MAFLLETFLREHDIQAINWLVQLTADGNFKNEYIIK